MKAELLNYTENFSAS